MFERWLQLWFSPKGRVSRKSYIIYFMAPILLLFVAANYADEAICLIQPTLHSSDSSLDSDRLPQILPDVVLEGIEKNRRVECRKSSIFVFQNDHPNDVEYKLKLGFSYDNGRISGAPFQTVLILLILWPLFAVNVKRLHDCNIPATWLVGSIVVSSFLLLMLMLRGMDYENDMLRPQGWFWLILLLLVQFVQNLTLWVVPGNDETNKFGPNPNVKTL